MKIIILHDADARIEYLDVADHLIGSDIEEFLTRQGFSVNNITWLATSADHIPVVYHKYDIDRKTGEATHTQREAEVKDLTIHGQLQALQHREQEELKAALRKYGTEVDGGFEVHFEGEQPIVAGYLFDEPRDIVIDAARLDADGNLSLLGEDKEVRDGQYDRAKRHLWRSVGLCYLEYWRMDEGGAGMTQCIVYDETTKESETFCSLTAAKRWMRERIKQKHKVSGQKYRVYSDGEFVNCGSISLTGSNKSFVANTRQTKKGY